MRGNLKRRFVYEDLFEQEPPVPSQTSSSSLKSWKLKLSWGQLLGVWLGISGMLLTAFIVGLYTGRDQGLRYALNEQGREAVRMPIARAVITLDNSQSNGFDNIALTSSLTEAAQVASPEENTEEKQDLKYNFSNSVVTGISAPSSTVLPPASSQNHITKKHQNDVLDSVTQAPSANFFVQVGTVKSPEEVTSIVNNLEKSLLPAKIQETDISGRRYFRVLVGPFASKQGADDQKNQIASSRKFKSQPFVRQIP